MSILIKGMEMPSCCGECQFTFDEEFLQCKITGKRFFKLRDAMKNRHPDCPLNDIPPHGRLNVIEPYMQHDEDDGFDELIKPSDIDYMRTPSVEEIIEADGLDSFIKHFED